MIPILSTTTGLKLNSPRVLIAGGLFLAFAFSSFSFEGYVSATPNPVGLRRREAPAPENTVVVNDAGSYCLVVPKDAYTDIGDSEQPGGTTTYCSPSAHTASSSSEQGVMPDGFWTNVEFVTALGGGGGRYVQLTGCIDPSALDRINPDDEGGQYDSSGGADGMGNPVGSVCEGYNHYVELLEPAGPRACIRCCEDADDCPTHMDTEGCPNVIPGNYFDCE